MSDSRPALWKRLLILPPLILGIAFLVWTVKGREGPTREDVQETVTRARVVTVAPVDLVPTAKGFGTVSPGKVWEGIAEVSGTVVAIHPNLKRGALLGKGDELVRIDATDYRLSVERTEADIAALDAQLAELDARRKNFLASLEIEKRSLALSERDLVRKKDLFKTRAVSQAAVDQEERNLLARRQAMQNIENSLNLLPTERLRLLAQRKALNVRLVDARRNVDRTIITLPFDARISDVTIETSQFAKTGQTLVKADSIELSEISAQMSVDHLARLVDGLDRADALSPDLFAKLGAVVRFRSGGLAAEWPGRVARVSDEVDPRTRTVGLIVAVDDPYRPAAAGDFRPPLAKNMFVEVELRGPVRPGRLTIPRTALHGGNVYRLDGENRLRITPVTLRFTQGDMAVIGSGLAPGDRIVVSDLIPAIDGMKIEPLGTGTKPVATASDAAGGAQ